MTDAGWKTPSDLYFARGTVVEANGGADPFGVLEGIEVGDQIVWRGRTIDPEGNHFVGPFLVRMYD